MLHKRTLARLHELAAPKSRCLLASAEFSGFCNQLLREFEADILKSNCPLSKKWWTAKNHKAQ